MEKSHVVVEFPAQMRGGVKRLASLESLQERKGHTPHPATASLIIPEFLYLAVPKRV